MEKAITTIEDLMTEEQLKLTLEFADIYRLMENARTWNVVGDETILRVIIWMKRHTEANDLNFWPMNQIDVTKHKKRGKGFIDEFTAMIKGVDEDVISFLEHALDHSDSVNDVIEAKVALLETKLKAEATKTLFGSHRYSVSKYGRVYDYAEMIEEAEEELVVNENVYKFDLDKLTELLIKHKA